MSIYKLHNAFTASADSGASLDIQFDGLITVVDWACRADMDADAESFGAEVSFLSSSTFVTNDSRGSISMVRGQAGGAEAAGFSWVGVNKSVSGLRIAVAAGERIHLHGVLGGSADLVATCYVHVEDTSDPRLRRRR